MPLPLVMFFHTSLQGPDSNSSGVSKIVSSLFSRLFNWYTLILLLLLGLIFKASVLSFQKYLESP